MKYDENYTRVCFDTTDRVEPCPFCGGEANPHLVHAGRFCTYAIRCEDCHAEVTSRDSTSSLQLDTAEHLKICANLLHAWNRRTISLRTLDIKEGDRVELHVNRPVDAEEFRKLEDLLRKAIAEEPRCATVTTHDVTLKVVPRHALPLATIEFYQDSEHNVRIGLVVNTPSVDPLTCTDVRELHPPLARLLAQHTYAQATTALKSALANVRQRPRLIDEEKG